MRFFKCSHLTGRLIGLSEALLNLLSITLNAFDGLCSITTFVNIVDSAYELFFAALMFFANLVKTEIVLDVDFDIVLSDF